MNGKIDTAAAVTLMRIFSDLAVYNTMISREANLRFFDETGLFNNPGSLKYIARLFRDDGDAVMERIKSERPILQLMTHMIFPGVDLAFKAFGKRLKVIEMARHPLYMIEGWHGYIDRCGSDPREFTLWIEHAGKRMPWFASGWEERFMSLGKVDRVIHSIKWFMDRSDEVMNALGPAERAQVLVIPFERFVIDPYPYLVEIESFLGTRATPAVEKALRRQKCPRKHISEGRAHSRWGGKPPQMDDIDDYRRRARFVGDNASGEALDALEEMSLRYEERFGLKRQSPWNLVRGSSLAEAAPVRMNLGGSKG